MHFRRCSQVPVTILANLTDTLQKELNATISENVRPKTIVKFIDVSNINRIVCKIGLTSANITVMSFVRLIMKTFYHYLLIQGVYLSSIH